jgi:hypothetical protein
MHEIDVDMIGLEPLQALLDRGEDAGTAAVSAVRHFVIADAEFGRYDVVSAWPKRSRKRLFGRAHPVGLGRVEAADAAVDRLRDRTLELALVDTAVGATDLPQPKPIANTLRSVLPNCRYSMRSPWRPLLRALEPAATVAVRSRDRAA